jgi:hypothetical protein
MADEQQPSPTPQPVPAPAPKAPWQSKTVWLAIILAVAALFPQVDALIKAYPDYFATITAALFTAMRMISHGKIEIS